MRRAPILTAALVAVAGGVLLAGEAAAQSPGRSAADGRGLRQLSWPGRIEAARAAPAAAAPARRDLRRPNTVIPHGGFAPDPGPPTRPGLTPAPGARRTLTPANAWMHPAAPTPEPVMAPAPPAAPQPPPSPAPRAVPDNLPDLGGRGQAVPAEVVDAPRQQDPYDPMAPRRDAPIFHMQQPPPAERPPAAPVVQPAASSEAAPRPLRVAEVVNTDERPPVQGGRYYSVHRQNGRQPDAFEIPEPTYVDALAVTMPETIASQDLAVPEPGPTLIRDSQGRLRPAPAASDGDYQ